MTIALTISTEKLNNSIFVRCRTLHPRPKGEGSASARSLLVPRRPPPEEVQLQRQDESVLRAAAAEQVPSSPRRRQRARKGARRTRRRLALLEVAVEVKIAAAEKEVAVAQGVFGRSGAEVSPRRHAIEVSPPCGNDARNRLGTQRLVGTMQCRGFRGRYSPHL